MQRLSRQSILLYALCLLAIGFLTWFFSNIVLYFSCALVLSTLLKPIVNALYRLCAFNTRMHRSLVILLSFALILLVLWAVFSLFLPLIRDQIAVLNALSYERFLRGLELPLSHIEDWLIRLHITDQTPGFLLDIIRTQLFSFFESIEIGMLLNEFVGFTGGVFIAVISIVFLTFMLLYEEQFLYRSFIAFVPNRYFEVIISWAFRVEQQFVSYLGGLFTQMGIIFFISTCGLAIINVKYAATIGLFAALANLVPYLGPILGTFFAIVVSLSAYTMDIFSYEAFSLVLQIGLVFLFVQLIDNLLVQPLVFSRSIKAHPIEVFLIIFVGANIAGILGMILAIPAYTIVKASIIEGYRGFSEYRSFRGY